MVAGGSRWPVIAALLCQVSPLLPSQASATLSQERWDDAASFVQQRQTMRAAVDEATWLDEMKKPKQKKAKEGRQDAQKQGEADASVGEEAGPGHEITIKELRKQQKVKGKVLQVKPLSGRENISSIPLTPPAHLTARPTENLRLSRHESTLGGFNQTTGTLFFRMFKEPLDPTLRAFRMVDAGGWPLFASAAELGSITQKTYFYEASSARRVAVAELEIGSAAFAGVPVLGCFEVVKFWVYTYSPVCQGQKSTNRDQQTHDKLFKYARVIHHRAKGNSWAVSRYRCESGAKKGGSLQLAFHLNKTHHKGYNQTSYDAKDLSNRTFGTLDKCMYFDMSHRYDAWVAPGEDLVLFMVAAMITEMHISPKGLDYNYGGLKDKIPCWADSFIPG